MNRPNKVITNLAVEGATEKWYFEHLENLINNYCKENNRCFSVEFNIKITGKSDCCVNKARRMVNSIQKLLTFAVFDYEKKEDESQFKSAIRNAAKSPKVECAYSNLHLNFGCFYINIK